MPLRSGPSAAHAQRSSRSKLQPPRSRGPGGRSHMDTHMDMTRQKRMLTSARTRAQLCPTGAHVRSQVARGCREPKSWRGAPGSARLYIVYIVYRMSELL
eukprot:4146668-Prymnesium_polylepis.1